MDRHEAMRIFLRVAELSSFTGAAESLGLPKATVSQAVQQLEALAGTRLLHRTTRRVSVTLDGQAFYERCRDLVADLEEMFRAGAELAGRLRVDMPTGYARRLILPRLPEFLELHPRLELEISTTDRRVDAIAEGFDCVLRVGFSPEPGLVHRQIGQLEVINCVSPAYQGRHGLPRQLADLDQHRLVHYSPVLGGRSGGFEYFDGESYRLLPMEGAVTVNSSDAYQMACLSGLGIIQVPRVGVRDLLEDGSLLEVLPELKAEPMPIALLYPHRRNLSRRVKAFLDWAEELVTGDLSGPG